MKKTKKAWTNISSENNLLRDTECDHFDIYPEQIYDYLIPCTITYEVSNK